MVIHTANLTHVAGLNLSIRYKLIKMLKFGSKGTRGTLNANFWVSFGKSHVHNVLITIILNNIIEPKEFLNEN